jgi:hypothetical protein
VVLESKTLSQQSKQEEGGWVPVARRRFRLAYLAAAFLALCALGTLLWLLRPALPGWLPFGGEGQALAVTPTPAPKLLSLEEIGPERIGERVSVSGIIDWGNVVSCPNVCNLWIQAEKPSETGLSLWVPEERIKRDLSFRGVKAGDGSLIRSGQSVRVIGIVRDCAGDAPCVGILVESIDLLVANASQPGSESP